MRALLFAIAFVAGGLALWLWLTQGQLGPDGIAARQPAVPMVSVLVAARDIPAETPLTEADLRWAPLPEASVVEGMATQTAQPEADRQVAGLAAAQPIAAGAPIFAATLRAPGGAGLAARLQADRFALAIVVSDASAVGGLVLPGDRIDLLRSRAANGAPLPQAEVIARDLRVLAVDQALVAPAEAVGITARTLTLELTEAQVPQIAAANAGGGLSVALRGRKAD